MPRPPAVETGRTVAVIGAGPAGPGRRAAAAPRRATPSRSTSATRPAAGWSASACRTSRSRSGSSSAGSTQLAAEGVRFEYGVDVGRRRRRGASCARDHDAVVIATGSRVPRDLPVPGRELDGVHFAMEYLYDRARVLDGDAAGRAAITAAGKHVLVVGGGDTGADCVGHSHREGAASVTQIELLGEPPESRPDDLTPWPRWPVKLRTLLRAQGGRRARLRDLHHQADRQRPRRAGPLGQELGQAAVRRRSRAPRSRTRPTSCCSRWASCTPSSRCSRRSASRRDPRGNAKAGAYATSRRRRLRRRRRAPRPVADRVGDQRGPPVRPRRRPLPARACRRATRALDMSAGTSLRAGSTALGADPPNTAQFGSGHGITD